MLPWGEQNILNTPVSLGRIRLLNYDLQPFIYAIVPGNDAAGRNIQPIRRSYAQEVHNDDGQMCECADVQMSE